MGNHSPLNELTAPESWAAVATLVVPVPPSTNNLYRNVSRVGRVLTEAYKRWRNDAGMRLLAQRAPKLLGEVRVEFTVPRDGRRDLDNTLKPLLDLLVRQRVIERDDMTCVVGVSIECEAREDVAIVLRQRAGIEQRAAA